MSLLKKLQSAFASRERRINTLADAIVLACSDGVSDSGGAAILEEAMDANARMAVMLYATKLDRNHPTRLARDAKCIRIVALAESMLQLFKEDMRMLGGSFSNEEGAENA